jgi:hypothetical protein
VKKGTKAKWKGETWGEIEGKRRAGEIEGEGGGEKDRGRVEGNERYNRRWPMGKIEGKGGKGGEIERKRRKGGYWRGKEEGKER